MNGRIRVIISWWRKAINSSPFVAFAAEPQYAQGYTFEPRIRLILQATICHNEGRECCDRTRAEASQLTVSRDAFLVNVCSVDSFINCKRNGNASNQSRKSIVPNEDISKLGPALREEINDLFRSVRLPAVARVLWERLSESEIASLQGDLTTYCNQFEGAIGMWTHLKHVPRLQAVVEVAHETDLITSAKFNSLLRKLPGHIAVQQVQARPEWDASAGELWYGGQVVRRVRCMKLPTKIQQLLDVFQAAEWPRSVAARTSWDQQSAHQTVNSLNNGLLKIRFRVRDGGQTFAWQAKK